MTVVLVHGNPETDAIWGPLAAALGRDDVVRLSPPGFGAPMPADFPMTFVAYRDWLESSDLEPLRSLANQGREHWEVLAGQLLALWERRGTDAQQPGQELVRSRYL